MGRPRTFDYELATVMRYEGGYSLTELAAMFGVSDFAISRATDPAVRERAARYQREHETWKVPCIDCGAPSANRYQRSGQNRNGRCRACHNATIAKDIATRTTLRCNQCGEWKPDAAFSMKSRRPLDGPRRGRRAECRDCDAARRYGHRVRNSEAAQAYDREYHRRKRAAA